MRPLNQDTEILNSETPQLAPNLENAQDESSILPDQDETQMANLSADDPNIGSDGTDEYGLDSADFARGEIDVKEQMDRVTAAMDDGHHRPRDPQVTPHSQEGRTSTTDLSSPSKRDRSFKPSGKGHETGAYTDIGAGKSGVTKTHH